MKNNLPASSPNRVSNIPTNANISIAVHKDLSGHVAGFLAFTFPDVPFHCERCRQVLIVYRRKASNVYGVSNKRLQFWKNFKFFCYPSILMFFLLSNKSHHWNYTSTGILGTKKINWKIQKKNITASLKTNNNFFNSFVENDIEIVWDFKFTVIYHEFFLLFITFFFYLELCSFYFHQIDEHDF